MSLYNKAMGSYMSTELPKTSWPVLHQEVIKMAEDAEVELDEPEISYLHFTRCLKNPGHTKFRPVSEFTLNDLPREWQDAGLYRNILRFARRAVKVKVAYTSPKRPDKYAMSDYRGTKMPTSGSGMCLIIDEDRLTESPIECPLQDCSVQRPHFTTPIFKVGTAKHVVFDEDEARHTTVEFFYDSDDRSTVISGQVLALEGSLIDTDNCFLLCVSHDLSLFEKICAKNPPSASIPYPLPPSIPRAPAHQPTPPLVVVISHPHGQEKHISVGELRSYQRFPDVLSACQFLKLRDFLPVLEAICPSLRTTGIQMRQLCLPLPIVQEFYRAVEKNPEATFGDVSTEMSTQLPLKSISYTAATCPGCSGAFVFVVPKIPVETFKVFSTHYAHRRGKNISGMVDIYMGKDERNTLLSTVKEEKYKPMQHGIPLDKVVNVLTSLNTMIPRSVEEIALD